MSSVLLYKNLTKKPTSIQIMEVEKMVENHQWEKLFNWH